MAEDSKVPVFQDISADSDLDKLTETSSICMSCYREGVTRMLPTKIPHFGEIIVISFNCSHCGNSNAGVEPANPLQDKGCRYSLSVSVPPPLVGESGEEEDVEVPASVRTDLNRQVVKGPYCTIEIPEMQFSVPPSSTKRGELTTIEGFLTQSADALDATYLQSIQDNVTPEQVEKIRVIVEGFREMAQGKRSFNLMIDDPSGNSFIENPSFPAHDERCAVQFFTRTKEQTLAMGFAVEQKAIKKANDDESDESDEESDEDSDEEGEEKEGKGIAHSDRVGRARVDKSKIDGLNTYFNVTDRAAVLPGQCHACQQESETRMCVTDIPHFKQVIIMCTECIHCGFRDAEVKPGGAVSPCGIKIECKVTGEDDLKRDMLKADSSKIIIPEIKLDMEYGTLGGKFTTVEGILLDIQEQISRVHRFQIGDSASSEQVEAMTLFLADLKDCVEAKKQFTLILDDPLGNSYIGCVGLDQNPLTDPALNITHYERSFDQNEEYGLNSMKTENYATPETETTEAETPAESPAEAAPESSS